MNAFNESEREPLTSASIEAPDDLLIEQLTQRGYKVSRPRDATPTRARFQRISIAVALILVVVLLVVSFEYPTPWVVWLSTGNNGVTLVFLLVGSIPLLLIAICLFIGPGGGMESKPEEKPVLRSDTHGRSQFADLAAVVRSGVWKS